MSTTEVDVLAGARRDTDEALGELLASVAKRHHSRASRETEIRLVATAALNRARLNGAFRHGLAAGDRVNLSRPVGHAGRPLLP